MKDYAKSKMRVIAEWLGIIGACSCYVAMFPLSLVGIVGMLGISTISIIPALHEYMASPFFQPVLLFSIVLFIVGMLPFGKAEVALSLVAGTLIFISMNVSMRAWLFLLALLSLAAAHILGSYRRVGVFGVNAALVSVLPLLIVTIILGAATYWTASSDGPGSMRHMPSPTDKEPMMLMQ